MPFNKKHFDCEGPLGLLMIDAQARVPSTVLFAKRTPDDPEVLHGIVPAAKGLMTVTPS